jgi:hypothetical protein
MMLAIVTNSTSKGCRPALRRGGRPAGVIVRVREAGHDGHLLRVDELRPFGGAASDGRGRSDSDEPAIGDCHRFGSRHRRVHRVDARVEHDELGLRLRGLPGQRAHISEPGPRDERRGASRAKGHELPPGVVRHARILRPPADPECFDLAQ